jgi:hypothetical protein
MGKDQALSTVQLVKASLPLTTVVQHRPHLSCIIYCMRSVMLHGLRGRMDEMWHGGAGKSSLHILAWWNFN